MTAYLEFEPYPEVRRTLELLREQGMPLAILSNGSPRMLEAAVAASGFGDLELQLYSVEAVGIYKPDRRAYQLACDRLSLPAGEISFQSSNAWDAAGAAAFGMSVARINRFDPRRENLPHGPAVELRSLAQLPPLLHAGD